MNTRIKQSAADGARTLVGVLAMATAIALAASGWCFGQYLPPSVPPPIAPAAAEDPFGEPALPQAIEEMLEEAEPESDEEPSLSMARPGQPLTPEQQEAFKVVQKYMGVRQIERTPAAMLREKARRLAPEGPAAKPAPGGEAGEVQQFYAAVITGDWKGVQDELARLPKDAGPKVYGHVLRVLLAGRQGIVLPDEILLLADASPQPPDRDQLSQLGQLLARARSRVGEPKAALARLTSGTRWLGGKEPAARVAGAQVLIAAGMIDEALRYLPPLAEAVQTKDPLLMSLHARCLAAKKPGEDRKEAPRQAWNLTTMVLDVPKLEEPLHKEAVARLISLISEMPEEDVVPWSKKAFGAQPDLALRLLADAAERAEKGFRSKATQPRVEALAAQHRLAEGLLEAVAKTPEVWSGPLRMATLVWLHEATFALQRGGSPGDDDAVDVEQLMQMQAGFGSGSPAYSPEQIEMLLDRSSGGNEIRPLRPEQLLSSGPDEAWCKALDADLGDEVRRRTGQLAARAADQAKTFAVIRLIVGDDPKFAKELAEQFLTAWSSKLGHRDSSDEERYGSPFGYPRGYYPGMSYGSSGYRESGGVPLARAMQARNLARLGVLLAEIKAMKVPPLGEGPLVRAFDACHSPAEVYREEDLKQVFGDLESLGAETCVQIAAAMRQKLAGQWRQPELQAQMATQRTDKDLVAEVTRGYRMLIGLVDRVAAKNPQNSDLLQVLATVYFDQAEFLYGQKVELKTYIALRDSAFKNYRKAAELYAAELPTLPLEKQSGRLYQQWFQSALGASDLAYLTRQDRPEEDEVKRLAAAIHGLGGEATERHLKRFGDAVTASLAQVPPHLKPHYLRQALRVLGDHASGEKAREKLQLYDDLLAEVQLHAAVDGSADVGHGQSFGLHLSVRSTTALGRESGGFAFLLGKSYSRSTGQEIDHSKNLEQEIGEKLGESFEIEMIRFHDPKVTPRRFGRPGWQEMPLAYVVARAKNASVDRIPSVQVDVEFNDGSGAVLLPIASQVVLIDARSDAPPARPAEEIKVTQLLDDRRLDKGAAQLEVSATANGLLSSLDRLLAMAPDVVPGFKAVKTEDQGLEIKSLDTSTERIFPVCQRRWVVELQPTVETPVKKFAFPKPVDSSIAVAYQRYADADIVDAAAVVPLRVPLLQQALWPWLAGAVACAVLAVGAVIVYRRRRGRTAVQGPRYRRPERLTPFSLVVLLRRIHDDQGLPLPEAERHALAAAIDGLERRYFSPSASPPAVEDLTALVDHWLAVAANGSQ